MFPWYINTTVKSKQFDITHLDKTSKQILAVIGINLRLRRLNNQPSTNKQKVIPVKYSSKIICIYKLNKCCTNFSGKINPDCSYLWASPDWNVQYCKWKTSEYMTWLYLLVLPDGYFPHPQMQDSVFPHQKNNAFYDQLFYSIVLMIFPCI